MKNWRTLAASLLFAISLNGDLLELPTRVRRIATFISIVVFGYNTKDKQVTGGIVFQGDSRDVAEAKALQTVKTVASMQDDNVAVTKATEPPPSAKPAPTDLDKI